MAGHADLFEPAQGERGGHEFRNGRGEPLQAIDWNRTAESGWANTNGFYQPNPEAALEDLAVATPGVRIHRGWTFHALAQSHGGVTVELAPTMELAPTEQPSPDRPPRTVEVQARW